MKTESINKNAEADTRIEKYLQLQALFVKKEGWLICHAGCWFGEGY